MASKAKEGNHGKEKSKLSPFSPQNINSFNGRTPPKSSISSLPHQNPLITSENPHYMKPTVSFSKETCIHANRHASRITSIRYMKNKKPNNSPKSPSHIQKTPRSASPRWKQSGLLRDRKIQPLVKQSLSKNGSPINTSDWSEEEECVEERVVEMIEATYASQDQSPPDWTDLEKLKSCDSFSLLEEQGHNHHEDDDKEQLEESIKINGEEGEDSIDLRLRIQGVRSVPVDSGDEGMPCKLTFRQGEELECLIEESKPDAENVVLRHQEVQDKKEALAFNDVIEEMVSKLVEERKSKVKALVGAFETVFLLQEPKNPVQRSTDFGNRNESKPSVAIN